jgi:hypothetical protein
LAGFCEDGNEPLGRIKAGNFLTGLVARTAHQVSTVMLVFLPYEWGTRKDKIKFFECFMVRSVYLLTKKNKNV